MAFAIGRQAGVNISIPQQHLLARAAPAVRGRLSAAEALSHLARGSGLRVKQVGGNSYLLVPAPRVAAAEPLRKPARAVAVATIPQEPETAPQDIVVTASKRDLLSRRFPGQWSRIDGEEFGPLGVTGIEAVEARSVGFSSTHLGAGRNKLFIRGIADSSFSGATQSPVGQYFGDMRTGYSGPDPDLKLVDMEAVEILEGPQGTLYGSGALGGIVLLKPNMPAFGELSGRAVVGGSLTWHGDAGHDSSIMLNLPLGANSALRAIAYQATEGGYIDNVATGEDDINTVGVTGARATLSAELMPGWIVDLSGLAQRIDGDDSQYADGAMSGLARDSLVAQPFESAFKLASLVVRKDSGAVRFRSTTGGSWQDVDEHFDASTRDAVRRLGQYSRARALSNETRVWRPMADGYSWLIGFSSIAHRYKVHRDLRSDDTTSDLSGVENRVRETTLYGELGAELLPAIEASVGGRFSVTRLTGSGQHLSPPNLAELVGSDPDRTERRFLPSAALLARPTEGLTVYGRYQQGFRPGGLSISADTVRLYRNDRLGTAELGFRYSLPLRHGFDLHGSATRSAWSDIQADFLDPAGLPVTANIGDGRVWTVTVNGGVRLTPALRLSAGVAWNEGRITKPTDDFRTLMVGSDTDPMEIPNIAKVIARGSVDWRHRLGGEWHIEANAYARYVGRSRLGVGPYLGERQGEYVDSGLVLRAFDQRRAISLTVTNLTDEVGNRFAFGAPIASGADQLTPLRPRTIRLGFEQAF
ncbi:TonB-dependent receptor domain-containing protein [Sphingomonas xanthus]|uniref:TonB-dependent receptor domain-containing protein n=1 Tax=Sphingomonas xanthus TaxID=2594473 RepID=UPI00164D4E75|nr:TonB-dependent receptor [Sphingomonas xanthus]